ncbi:MAG: hypothetical protein IID34_08790 [Planctomycetes bacterium]|nr:hypothetical protein [Planctomycetota bacterium]
MRTLRITGFLAALLIAAHEMSHTPLVSAQTTEAGAADTVQIRLEVLLDSRLCVVLQNPTLVVRMVNPNSFPVRLPGFEFGYIEPELQAAGPGEGFKRIYYGSSDSARRAKPVVLPAGGVWEHRRFLHDSFDPDRWPSEPGTYAIRAVSHFTNTVAEDGGTSQQRIEWSYKSDTLRVVEGKDQDIQAMKFIRDALTHWRAQVRDNTAGNPSLFYAGMYSDVLARFGGSAYVPELRMELPKVLLAILERRPAQLRDDEVSDYLLLLENCVASCLDRGSPYSDPLLAWNVATGGNPFVEVAMKYDRSTLLENLVQHLDQKDPSDVEAISFRHLLVEGVTSSYADAQKSFKRYLRDYPDGRYTQMSRSFMRMLARKD